MAKDFGISGPVCIDGSRSPTVKTVPGTHVCGGLSGCIGAAAPSAQKDQTKLLQQETEVMRRAVVELSRDAILK